MSAGYSNLETLVSHALTAEIASRICRFHGAGCFCTPIQLHHLLRASCQASERASVVRKVLKTLSQRMEHETSSKFWIVLSLQTVVQLCREKVQPRRMAMDCWNRVGLILLSLWSLLAVSALAASSSVVTNGFTVPPFQIEIWAANVTGARGLVIDDAGDVLVVAKGIGGIYAFWEEPDGQVNRTLIVNNSNLNHGITLYGNHLYASSSSTVWRWSYRAGQRASATGQQTVVQNINQDGVGVQMNDGHQTRSLAIDRNRILYVSVGSMSNVDTDSFRARIRSFNLSSIPSGGFDFVGDGVVFADGVRNEVGLGFDGKGQLWGVENGADELNRNDLGGDIHNDNPAEELNLFNGRRGAFYGYPFCWSEYNLEKFGTGPGSQWAWPTLQHGTITDDWCKDTGNVRPPELAMQAHSAPLGVTFYDGTNCGSLIGNSTDDSQYASYSMPCEFSGDAFVAFHGSWNRDIPIGFKVVRIAFDNRTGLPISRNDSSIFDIFGAINSQTACGESGRDTCLRPVDLKFDRTGALLVTSDATGEIIRATSSNAAGVGAPAPSPSPPSSAPPIGCRIKILLRAFAPPLLCLLWWHSAHFHRTM